MLFGDWVTLSFLFLKLTHTPTHVPSRSGSGIVSSFIGSILGATSTCTSLLSSNLNTYSLTHSPLFSSVYLTTDINPHATKSTALTGKHNGVGPLSCTSPACLERTSDNPVWKTLDSHRPHFDNPLHLPPPSTTSTNRHPIVQPTLCSYLNK